MKGAHEFQEVAVARAFFVRADRGAALAHLRGRRLARRRQIAVETDDVGLEDAGDLIEPSGADAVGASLVFLDLLETDAEFRGEFLLAQTEERALAADLQSDDGVNVVRRAFAGSCFFRSLVSFLSGFHGAFLDLARREG